MKNRGYQTFAALTAAFVCAPFVGMSYAHAAENDGVNTTLTLTDTSGNLTEKGEAVARVIDGERTDNKGAASASLSSSSSRAKKTGILTSFAYTAKETAPAADYSSYLYMTKPLEANRFSVAGLTWNPGQNLPGGAIVEMRTLDKENTWSPWYALEVEDDEGGRPGTEANVSGRSTGIQIRIVGQGDLPAGLQVSMLGGQERSEEVTEPALAQVEPKAGSDTEEVANSDAKALMSASEDLGAQGARASLTASGPAASEGATPNLASLESGAGAGAATSVGVRPLALTDLQSDAAKKLGDIQPRSAWEADESLMKWPTAYAKLEGAIIHHTAGSNDYTASGVPSVIRSIYQYHAVTREWGDIGYNVLIDKFGNRWEGRRGTLASPAGQMAIGAHAAPRNTGTIGVSVMGNYSNITPSQTVLDTLSDVIASAFAIGGVDPRSKGPLEVPPRSSTLTPGTTLPRIMGHRDVNVTACPANIYPQLDVIRADVERKYDRILSPMTATLSATQELESLDVKATLQNPTTQWPRFKWLSYNLQTKEWTTESDWSWSPILEWRATPGIYWLQLQVGAADTGRTIYTETVAFNYGQAGTARIEGTYAGPTNGGILLGNNAPKAGYVVTKIYDVGRGLWIQQFYGPWALWKPVKGVYWTHFEAYTSDGRLVDTKTYPFGVN